jgi:hypothetical protein
MRVAADVSVATARTAMVATVISYRHHPPRVSNRRSVKSLELGVSDGLVGEEGEAVTNGTDHV